MVSSSWSETRFEVDITEVEPDVGDQAYRPLFVCAETADPCVGGLGRKDPDFLVFMRSKGYEVYADTYVNTIFIEKTVLEKMYV